MFDKAPAPLANVFISRISQECIDLSTQPDPEVPPSKQPKLSDNSLPIFNPPQHTPPLTSFPQLTPGPFQQLAETPLASSVTTHSTDPPAF
ncbi:hypothetical protein SEMRO_1860_G302120.1 [Seminavis robusta]|uniref:Uncharacterized protein n=1 Tax=Seminavis robusta TaxID=568900 RepID=A0A9N8HVS5_9STRA|nr:hypothetical protein SEMRO_1860_G302120.1 [Seminavis robusta]|eukprot:Sro1860_g302120.1 n/a (91) ;mRNA; f:12930-13202